MSVRELSASLAVIVATMGFRRSDRIGRAAVSPNAGPPESLSTEPRSDRAGAIPRLGADLGVSIYDRVLRTFTSTHRALQVIYGLGDAGQLRDMTLAALLAMPFRSGDSVTAGQQTAEVRA